MGSLFIADIEETCLLADTFERATLLLLGHVVVHWDEKHMNALLAFPAGRRTPPQRADHFEWLFGDTCARATKT